MTQVLSCQPYHGISAGQTVLNMPDGRSVFKLYLLSIIDRDEPALYDWASSRLSISEFKVRFRERGYEGVGFVIAFPHITKIFAMHRKSRLWSTCESWIRLRWMNWIATTMISITNLPAMRSH